MGEPDPLMEGYSNRCKSVFNFEQVTIKTPASQEGEEPSKRKSAKSEDRFYKPPSKRSRAPDPDEEDASAAPPVKTEDFKGRESLFRVPDNEWKKPTRETDGLDVAQFRKPRGRGGFRGRGGRGGRMPDFAKNPEKYTKYSLKDVDLTNNRSNSETAFAFLDSLKKRSQGEEAEEKFDAAQSDQKIVFKKPTKKKSDSDSSSNDASSAPAASTSSTTSGPKKKKSSGPTLSFDMDDEEDQD